MNMIYVIDDDQSVLRALLLLLRAAGFQARAFSSVKEFFKQARMGDCDCIILDLHMPGMKGFDLMEILASQRINTKVIILTAFDDSESREKARQMNAAAFLTKPVDDQALIDTLKWAIRPEGKTAVGE